MSLAASAPGKLVLLGEYAVLDGAPALVAAVDRRASVRLTATGREDCRVDAPDLGVSDARCRLRPRARVAWADDVTDPTPLGLVTAVFQAASDAGAVPAFDAWLGTGAFFDVDGEKLGLGSSAALTVALTGALHRLAGLAPPGLADLVRTHRSLQGGRGSGVDIAAALHGGLVAYSGADTASPTALPSDLPAGVTWACVWTGRSTATGDYLQRVAGWRRTDPHLYARQIRHLTAIAEAGVEEVRRGDGAGLLETVRAYTDGLDRLGDASGTDIVAAEHQRIREVARRCGVAYKPCGAGGGDVGVGLSTDRDQLRTFRHEVEKVGYRAIDLTVDRYGLEVRDRGPLASAPRASHQMSEE